MKKKIRIILQGAFAIGSLICLDHHALAVDIGDPLYRGQLNDSPVRVEAIYDNFKRDYKMDGTVSVGTHDLGSISGTDSTDITIYMLRAHLLPSKTLDVYVDGGVIDKKSDYTSQPFIVGGGAKILVTEKEGFSLSALGMAHYVTSYDVKSNGYDQDLGNYSSAVSANWWEAGVGALAAYDYSLDPKTHVIPYAGALVSLWRGNADVDMTYNRYSGAVSGSATLQEDGPLSAILGCSLLMQTWTIRVEGRFIAEKSVSFGVGKAF